VVKENIQQRTQRGLGMTGYSVHLRKYSIPFHPAFLLYFFAWTISLMTIFVLGPIFVDQPDTWAGYYRSLGEMLRIWGGLFGVALFAVVIYLILRSLLIGSLKTFVLKLCFIERLLMLILIANVFWGVYGYFYGNPLSYVLGDTIRGMFIPVIYWIVIKSVNTKDQALFFTKVIIIGETILLIAFIPTGNIPFSFAGRTFLTAVFFTLLFEERKLLGQIVYSILVLFGIFTMLTTQAQRGIIIIFIAVIFMNYLFRLRRIKFSIVFFVFLLPVMVSWGVNEIFDLKIEKDIDVASERFSKTIEVHGRQKYFGLDESVFQRIGETIDTWRTLNEHSSIFLATGFGNGAILINKLITPSERSVYKTNKKHNLYITPVAILFRNGLIGLIIYSMLGIYFVKILFYLRKHRNHLIDMREIVYLKVLLLYQLSVLIMSLIVYWYVGNIIVAFTIPIIEILRRIMQKQIETLKLNSALVTT
jgi:hypothetical protein